MTTPRETTSAEEIREGLINAEPSRRPGMGRYILYYLRSKPLGTIGFSIVLLMILTAIFAPLIAPHTYQEQNYEAVRVAPSLEFPFGTDQFGRDIFSRVVYGAQISMMVGFLAVIAGTGAGAVVGLISGYFMGKTDHIVQRLVDMWMSFPDLILALTIVAVFGNTIPNVILAIAATIMPRGVRVIRSSTIAIREMDYTLGGPVHRSVGPADHAAARPAQHGGALPDYHVLHVRHRHPYRGGAELPGPGHLGADAFLGPDADGTGGAIPGLVALDAYLPGNGDHPHRDGFRLRRRRPARHLRSQAAGQITAPNPGYSQAPGGHQSPILGPWKRMGDFAGPRADTRKNKERN